MPAGPTISDGLFGTLFCMPTLTRPDGIIEYDVRGNGEPLVLLRGLGRSVRHWLGYDTELTKHFRVITVELRGIGGSTAPLSWTPTMAELASDIIAVLDAAAVPKAHILGVSLGGMVALALGLDHPERCLSLIVINTSIAGQRRLRMTIGGALGIFSGALRRDGSIHRHLAASMLAKDSPRGKVGEIAAAYSQIAAEEGLHSVTVVKQLVAALRFRVRDRLKRLAMPVLVVYGTADQFVPTVNSKLLFRRLPNAKLVPVPGAGHEIALDHGQELTRVLLDWVDGYGAVGQPRV